MDLKVYIKQKGKKVETTINTVFVVLVGVEQWINLPSRRFYWAVEEHMISNKARPANKVQLNIK